MDLFFFFKVKNVQWFNVLGIIMYIDLLDFNRGNLIYLDFWWMLFLGLQRGMVGGDGDFFIFFYLVIGKFFDYKKYLQLINYFVICELLIYM